MLMHKSNECCRKNNHIIKANACCARSNRAEYCKKQFKQWQKKVESKNLPATMKGIQDEKVPKV